MSSEQSEQPIQASQEAPRETRKEHAGFELAEWNAIQVRVFEKLGIDDAWIEHNAEAHNKNSKLFEDLIYKLESDGDELLNRLRDITPQIQGGNPSVEVTRVIDDLIDELREFSDFKEPEQEVEGTTKMAA